MEPKVFISHASEDKDRFVLAFAARLRKSGVNAWVDKWEILPGDSLIDKIFEEGLKEAEAVIVVLSKFSVAKPWVREELNHAAVKRISSQCKLIPVVIDDCDVPEVLKTIVRERISDLASYDESFHRIVAAIFGATVKPKLGPAPSYAGALAIRIGRLEAIDSLVLKRACEHTMEENGTFLDPETVFSEGDGLIVPETELRDALEVLHQQGYIEIDRTLSGRELDCFSLTDSGFEAFAAVCVDDYDDVIRQVISSIVNEGVKDEEEMARRTGRPMYLIGHILDLLAMNRHLQFTRPLSGHRHVYDTSPSLKRLLD